MISQIMGLITQISFVIGDVFLESVKSQIFSIGVITTKIGVILKSIFG